MKKKILLLTVLTIVSAMGTCQAKLLPSGTFGVINVPSAHVRSMGHVSAGWQWTDDGYFVAANAAVIRGIEVAASHIKPNSGDEKNVFSAKLEFLPETMGTPALAIGVEDATDQFKRAGYVVASKEAPWGLRLHAGVGTERFKHGFVALEKQFKLNSANLNLSLAAEYDGDNFNYGASLPLGKFLQAEVGVRSKNMFAGVNCTF